MEQREVDGALDGDLDAFRVRVDGSIVVAIRKNAELQAVAARAIRENERLRTLNKQLNDNLTSVQARCTELLLECRDLRRRAHDGDVVESETQG